LWGGGYGGRQQYALEAVSNRYADVDRYDLATARVVETKPFLLGSLSRVDFKRKDGSGKTVYGWAPELDKKSGRLRGGIEIFENTDQLIPFVSRAPTIKSHDTDFIKLTVISVLTFMFASVIYVVIAAPENKSLQVLTGLLGLTIGYFVGKGDTPSA
jgi:hypothetical protein